VVIENIDSSVSLPAASSTAPSNVSPEKSQPDDASATYRTSEEVARQTRVILTPATLSILDKAESLAVETGRRAVSSSCILFALAETASENRDTSWLVRSVLGRNSNYRDVYTQFLKSVQLAFRGQTGCKGTRVER
jgi:hypothetical protein